MYCLTAYQSQFVAWQLSRRMGADSADLLASTLVDAQVDLNPHQVEAALFAFRCPLSKGVILADPFGPSPHRPASPQCSLPPARLRFSYGAKVSTLQTLRGSSGWLALGMLTIEALGTTEDHLLLAATNDAGQALHDEDAEKLLRLPAELLGEAPVAANPPAGLQQGQQAQQEQRVREVNQRNLGYFGSEVQKLDAWADDLKGGLDNDVKELDREIKDVRRTALVAATLEEKLHWQKRQRELEDKRNQLRRRIFDRQDDIDDQRNRLIEALEGLMSNQSCTRAVFVIQWELT